MYFFFYHLEDYFTFIGEVGVYDDDHCIWVSP